MGRPLFIAFMQDVWMFHNPSSTTIAWVGAETVEVLLLNDFRRSSQIILWNDLLQMLEGQPVHLSTPKSKNFGTGQGYLNILYI